MIDDRFAMLIGCFLSCQKVVALDMINGLLEVFSCLNVTNQQLKISRDAELKLRNEFEVSLLIYAVVVEVDDVTELGG